MTPEGSRARLNNGTVLVAKRAWNSFPGSWIALLISTLTSPFVYSGFYSVFQFFGIPVSLALIAFLPSLIILFQLLARRFATTYRIHNGDAQILKLGILRDSWPILDANLKRKGWRGEIFGHATIEIASSNGLNVQEWVYVANVDRVFKNVLAASRGELVEVQERQELWRRLPPGLIEFLIDRGLISIDDSEDHMLCYWTRRRDFWRCKSFAAKLDYLKEQLSNAANERNHQKRANDIQIILWIIGAHGPVDLLEFEKATAAERDQCWTLFRQARENFEQYCEQLREATRT